MYNDGPTIWVATDELRRVETPHGGRLQRKWIECLPTCVITNEGPVPGCPIKEEWRDEPSVPAVP
jgi:hypothetical protein